jgi:hypothetical protein
VPEVQKIFQLLRVIRKAYITQVPDEAQLKDLRDVMAVLYKRFETAVTELEKVVVVVETRNFIKFQRFVRKILSIHTNT